MLENRIDELEKKITTLTEINNLNLLRLKNGHFLNDKAIFESSLYIDITAFKAHEIYLSNDHQFNILDVEESSYERPVELTNAIKIPIGQLAQKLTDLPSRMIPLFVISKDGVKSIEACELLTQNSYYNCYNISGGYEKWPKNKVEGINQTLD